MSHRVLAYISPTKWDNLATSGYLPWYLSRLVRRENRKISLRLFVGGIIVAGTLLTIAGFSQGFPLRLDTIGLLIALAVMAERLQIDVYEANTISVSAAINFAAALIFGVPGAALVSAAIVLTHYLRRRPALYKTAFNWAVHILAAVAPVVLTNRLAIPLQLSSIPLLAVSTTIAALAYYTIETGLIATAISLSEGANLIATWRQQFRWLAAHYLVLCLMGLFLSVGYIALGLLGLVVFALPILMMHYAQRQYVERTQDSVKELRRMYRELSLANDKVIEASRSIRQLNEELLIILAKIIDARDPYLSGHSAKVADYAVAIAMEMGLPPERVNHIQQAALLHDIGKIAIPERILHKPGRLTTEEYEYFQTHARLGAELLETCQSLRHLAPFVRHHHERWDGRGYPDGLRGDQIPLEARILAVCDAVEAMASDRAYHRAISLDEIVAELKRCAGRQFDSAVVEAFIVIAEREGNHLVINSAQEVAQNHHNENGQLFHATKVDFPSPLARG